MNCSLSYLRFIPLTYVRPIRLLSVVRLMNIGCQRTIVSKVRSDTQQFGGKLVGLRWWLVEYSRHFELRNIVLGQV